ncbi:MAG: phosphate ABC transporter permease [Sphingobacteriales bacterium UTBCD1]|jgi:lipopolysaccharide transport system permease protein|nr:MAG: phosphate ABC transporter permease [Sphingobacteriales bacterium UTBCD1]
MISKTFEERFDLVIDTISIKKNYWNDLWRYRELFFFLAWRDILVRYKQTVIGLAWSVIRPFLTMIVFTVIFGNLAKLPSGDVPYPILVFSAMLPWQFFSTSFSDASNSLIGNSNMLTKVYFPRMIIPASSVIVNMVDFFISFVILIGMMFWYRFIPPISILVLPVFFLQVFLISLGAGFYVAAVNVKYRDFKYIVPFIVNFGMIISPVGFSSSVVNEKWRLLYSMNPMVGVIDGFRWAITGDQSQIFLPGLFLSFGIMIVLILIGIWYFRKMERTFADLI